MSARKNYTDARLKLVRLPLIINSGAGSITTPVRCIALIFAWGAGCGGQGGGSTTAGAGAGALLKRVRMSPGQALAWNIGVGGPGAPDSTVNPGGDTKVTLPSGLVLIAGGAQSPTAPGAAVGGDENRIGGASGGVSQPGASPQFGGLGGASAGVQAGGGGAAGFSDENPDFIGGQGGAAINIGNAQDGAAPGGGGGASADVNGGAGANGRVIIVLVAIH